MVVDAGAHLGFYAILAGSLGADVLAIEPNPPTARALRSNVRLNQLRNVDVREVALGSVDGAATLEVPMVWDGKASLVRGWADGGRSDTRLYPVPVRVETLDGVVGPASHRPIDWLLIDVEGSELEVLEGAESTLRRTRRLLIEVSSASERACRALLEKTYHFRVVSVEPQTPHTSYLVALAADTPDPGAL